MLVLYMTTVYPRSSYPYSNLSYKMGNNTSLTDSITPPPLKRTLELKREGQRLPCPHSPLWPPGLGLEGLSVNLSDNKMIFN